MCAFLPKFFVPFCPIIIFQCHFTLCIKHGVQLYVGGLQPNRANTKIWLEWVDWIGPGKYNLGLDKDVWQNCLTSGMGILTFSFSFYCFLKFTPQPLYQDSNPSGERISRSLINVSHVGDGVFSLKMLNAKCLTN